jgi:WD40 repeat protein
VEGVLGRGGMGVVYRARQLALNRPVALKMILTGAHAAPHDLARFLGEAEAAARLQHPNIVQVHEVGRHEGRPYFTAELVEGGTLAQYIGHRPQSPRWAAALAETLARAVHYAHGRGIVHRDLKPANVLLTPHGIPKVTDFGLAKRLEGSEGLTRSGDLLGTPSYMAPEQALGSGPKVGPATDIYALGAVLYQMLTGRPPFQAETPLDTVLQVLGGEAVPVRRLQPKVPRDLETICHKCLHKEPRKRYASAEALADELHRFLGSEPVHARPVGTVEWVVKWVRRRPALAALVATVVLGTLLLAIAAIHFTAAVAAERDQANRLRDLADRRARAEQSERHRAETAERAARRQAADSTLERAQILCQQGELARGLLWMVEGLRMARQAADADLEDALRWNLGAWAREVHPLEQVLPHSGPVHALTFDPAGTTLATGGARGKVHLWDPLTGQPHGRLLDHPAAVNALAFHPAGDRLLTGCDDGVARVWQLGTGKALLPQFVHFRPARFPNPSWPFRTGVLAVSWSPNGKVIATAGRDGTARLWDAATGASLSEPLQHEAAEVTCLGFSPDGASLWTGSGDWRLRRWGVPDGRLLSSSAKVGFCFALAVHPRHEEVATGHLHDSQILRWDAATGNMRPGVLRHMEIVRALAYSPDGRLLLSGSDDHTARLWDTASGAPVGSTLRHPGRVHGVAFHPGGRRVATCGEDGSVRVWGLAPGSLRHTLRHPDWPQAVAFSPDGRRILTTTFGGAARQAFLWDVDSGAHAEPELLLPEGFPWYLTGAGFANGGRILVATDNQGGLHRWDARTGKRLPSQNTGQEQNWKLAVSPDGRLALCGAIEQKGNRLTHCAVVWDLSNGRPACPPLAHRDSVFGIGVSPDGKLAVTGSLDRTTRLWRLADGQPLGPPVRHGNGITAVAFRPDGKAVLTGGRDRFVRLWEVPGWKAVGLPLEHNGEVSCVLFSRDARLILTGAFDQLVRLWHPATQRPVGPVLRHDGQVMALACHPDGRRVASAARDRTARVWELPRPLIGTVEQVARRIERLTGMRREGEGAVRPLTPAEWAPPRR